MVVTVAADYSAGWRVLLRTLDHAVADEGLSFSEALEIHSQAVPGVLRASVEMRRAQQNA